MNYKIILSIVVMVTSIASLQATEPAHNPKQPHVENCKFLDNLIKDTTRQAKRQKNLQIKAELNKKIAHWEKQLEDAKCKKSNELSCKEIKELLDNIKKSNTTARYTHEEWKMQQERIKELEERFKICK